MKKIFILFTAAALVCFALAATGNGEDLHTNWREECRSAISGRYLSLTDETRHLEDYLKLLDGSLRRLRSLQDRAEKAAKEARIRAEKGDFVFDTEEERDTAEFHLKNIGDQIKNESELFVKSQAYLRETITKAEALKPKMLKVFAVIKVPASHIGGYSFRVDYLSPCPIYQLLCPLPKAEADHLLHMLPEDELPIACTRYAQIRGLNKN